MRVGLVGGLASSSPWSVGSSVHWTYHDTTKFSAFSIAGQRVFDDRLSSQPGDTAVIYFNHTWWTARMPGQASAHRRFWVDPATYLPIQMALPHQRTEFRWLAPTPANLAQLKVTVPVGFKQVPPPSA